MPNLYLDTKLWKVSQIILIKILHRFLPSKTFFEILQKTCFLDLLKNSISLWVFCTQCFSPNARSTMTRQFLNQRRHLWSGLAKDSRGVGTHGPMGPLAPGPPKLCHVTNKPSKKFYEWPHPKFKCSDALKAIRDRTLCSTRGCHKAAAKKLQKLELLTNITAESLVVARSSFKSLYGL